MKYTQINNILKMIMNFILFLLGIAFGMMLPKTISINKIIEWLKNKCEQ